MPAYLIVYRESPVRDPEEMQLYNAKARQLPDGGCKPTPRILEGAITSLEGKAPESVVMLEFPSVAAAKAWYDSPGYQAALPHRKNAADYRVIIAEGFAR
jgi:uncharacterized protein (DUF1330 family)